MRYVLILMHIHMQGVVDSSIMCTCTPPNELSFGVHMNCFGLSSVQHVLMRMMSLHINKVHTLQIASENRGLSLFNLDRIFDNCITSHKHDKHICTM